MEDIYTELYIHLIIAVKFRNALITDDYREVLHKYITGGVQDEGHKMLAINSVEDHLHFFIGMNVEKTISDLMRDIKKESTKFINKNFMVDSKFQWQVGYGAFSYSKNQIDSVVKYILNQREYHKKVKFRDEFIQTLKNYEVEYEEKYLFNFELE